MSWEAYHNIIVCYDMNIKYKMSKNKLKNIINRLYVFQEYIIFVMHVLLEYLNINTCKKILYWYRDVKIFVNVIEYGTR